MTLLDLMVVAVLNTGEPRSVLNSIARALFYLRLTFLSQDIAATLMHIA